MTAEQKSALEGVVTIDKEVMHGTPCFADQQTRFASTARRLASAGLTTESEGRSSRPALEITVADIRLAKLPPLPNFPAAVDGVSFHQ